MLLSSGDLVTPSLYIVEKIKDECAGTAHSSFIFSIHIGASHLLVKQIRSFLIQPNLIRGELALGLLVPPGVLLFERPITREEGHGDVDPQGAGADDMPGN